MTEYDAARKAANAAYAHRIMQHLGLVVELPEPRYAGNFDYMAVVNAAPIPKPDNHKHEWHWAEMWRIFDEEWRLH